MAQQYTTNSGQVLTLPGTFVSVNVEQSASGTPVAGVITIVGESSNGPDFTLESDLNSNAYGPDQFADVQNKYGSGRLVDAFRALVAPANDPQILGAVTLIKIVKTNPSLAAAFTISRNGLGTYATLTAASQGVSGNTIKYLNQIAQAEVAPSTGIVSYLPHFAASAVSATLIANGGAPLSASIAAGTQGAALVASFSNIADGILATGFTASLPITGSGTISCAPVGSSTTQLAITIPNDVTGLVSVGDSLVIPSASYLFGATGASAIVGTGSANAGSYLVQAISTGTSSVITANRINAPTGTGAVVSASGSAAGDFKDVIVYRQGSISNYTGQDRGALTGVTGTYSIVVTSNSNILITAPSPWNAQPVAGDLVVIPTAILNTGSSPILAGGFYQVLSSTASTVTLALISNGSAGTGGTSQSYTGPNPFSVLKPSIDGLGKSLQIVGDVSSIFKNINTGNAAPISNVFLASSAEQQVKTTIAQGNTTNSYTVGGNLVLAIGSSVANSTAVVSSTSITIKVSGTTQFTMPFANYSNLNNIVTYINSQPGYTASLFNARYGALSPTILDEGTFGLYTSDGFQPAQIKNDAYAWQSLVNGALVNVALTAVAGLPEANASFQFLSGGALGASSSANFSAALDACQKVDTNFVCTLISADATVDAANGQTDPNSTYSVDSVNSLLESHVIFMSTLTQRKNRLGLCGKSGTFAVQQQAAGNISSYRVGMCFQNVNFTNTSGTITNFQPWLAGVFAAGMQAAAGYKGIVKKFLNISGITKPEGDYDSGSYSNKVAALQAGLMPIERVQTGGYRWTSDQLTYSADNNFVYNSLQAVYIADLIVLTLIQNFDNAIVGQSVADVSAQGALSFLEGQMFNFLRLKWIAPSDDAPKGYRNASVRINGPVMTIALEIKLAGLIYFIPIALNIGQVEQTAVSA